MKLGMGAGIKRGGKVSGGVAEIFRLFTTDTGGGSVAGATFYLDTDITPVLLTALEFSLRDESSVIDIYYKLGNHTYTIGDYTLLHTSDVIVPNNNKLVDQKVELPTPFAMIASQKYAFYVTKASGRLYLTNEANSTKVGDLGLSITTDAGNLGQYSGNSWNGAVYYQEN